MWSSLSIQPLYTACRANSTPPADHFVEACICPLRSSLDGAGSEGTPWKAVRAAFLTIPPLMCSSADDAPKASSISRMDFISKEARSSPSRNARSRQALARLGLTMVIGDFMGGYMIPKKSCFFWDILSASARDRMLRKVL
jgi:hypothetical protein